MWPVLARHGDLGVSAVEGIEEIDVFEPVDPATEAQKIVRGGRQKIDRCLVAPEKPVDVGKACELFPFSSSCHLSLPEAFRCDNIVGLCHWLDPCRRLCFHPRSFICALL